MSTMRASLRRRRLTTQARPASGDPADAEAKYAVAVILLTQANRPVELARAVASVRAQQGVTAQIILIANGAPATSLDTDLTQSLTQSDKLIVLPENIGIPAGRNLGAEAADARLLMFLDDDAELLDPHLLRTVIDRFDANPQLGAMALRLIDEHGHSQQRHVPRIGRRSAHRSGPVTHFIGAACIIRATAFHHVDGFDPRFFYAMEESDLSWRLLDAGWTIWYSADLHAFHPHTEPARHQDFARLTARNRLWMAWRSLPAPLFASHITIWTILAIARGAPCHEVITGTRQAWTTRPPRHPMHWHTAAYMTRCGRPPII